MGGIRLILSMTLLVAAGSPRAPVDQDRLHGEIVRLLDQLDDNRFVVRRNAAERLEQLVAQPDLGPFLAAEFHRALVRPDVSFEVRWHLDRWRSRLPRPTVEQAANVSAAELDELVQRLDDDSYARRVGAAKRIGWLLGNPDFVCPLFIRLKHRMGKQNVGDGDHRLLETAYANARKAWLLSNPSGWQLPEVSDEQIDAWLDDLLSSSPRSTVAERELLDLLVEDEQVPRVAKAIASRQLHKLDDPSAARLAFLSDWTKPVVVSEIWDNRRCDLRQCFLIGVSTPWPGAPKPVLFDRADEQTAHCVSGNMLAPGDYPVGEAFPPPRHGDAGLFFHFVYLSTPRQRMAYAYRMGSDEASELTAISHRTLDRMLANRHSLSESELLMLDALDPNEVSRFAGRHFLSVDDRSLTTSGPLRHGGRPSRFGTICGVLAIDGTKEAVPGLMEAIAQDRFLPPTVRAPYQLHWIALLSIAARDPWKDVDAWLAAQIDGTERLAIGRSSAPELGATAAALLLRRHNEVPEEYGLNPINDPQLGQLHVTGYRFDDDKSREKVRRWWKQFTTRRDTDDEEDAAGRSSPRSPPAAVTVRGQSPFASLAGATAALPRPREG